MAVFPQLSTGAAAQYPQSRAQRTRTVSNQTLGGDEVKAADAGGYTSQWHLRYRGLTTAELGALISVFAASEGRLGRFTFLDPADNLLLWSEDFTAPAWIRGPMLQLTAGIADPFGGTGAFRAVNSGATTQSLTQAVNAPGTMHYCFSVWVRGQSGGTATLRHFSASASQNKLVEVTTGWSRVLFSGNLQINEEPVSFGLEIGPGASVDVFGGQVDAQPAPSEYRKTSSRGGVYGAARFDQDELEVVSEGPEQHAVTVRVVSKV